MRAVLAGILIIIVVLFFVLIFLFPISYDIHKAPPLDTQSPIIEFVLPTDPDSSALSRNWTEINVSISEPNVDEIVFNWNGTNYTIYDNHLNLMYKFDNVTGVENNTFVLDYSIYGNNGSCSTCPVWNSSGRHGGAYHFDHSTNDFFETADNPSLNPDDFTVAAWINLDNQPGLEEWYGIVSKGYYNANDGFELYVRKGNTTNPRRVTWSFGLPSVHSDYEPQPGEWVHVVGTYDGSDMKLYMNGNLNDTRSAILNKSSRDLAIGKRYGTGHSFQGLIDDVRFYSRALLDDEIKQLYNYDADKWNFFSNQTDLAEGLYTYYVYARDLSDNTNQSTRSLIIDSTPPLITNQSVDIPQEDEDVLFSATIQDAAVDYVLLDFNMTDNYTMQDAGNNTYTFLVNSSNYTSEDQVNWGIYAYDLAGLMTFGGTNSFVVESMPASVDITSPLEGATITTSSVVVIYNESGNLTNVSHVHLQLDSNPEVNDTDNDGVYLFSGLVNGVHAVHIWLVNSSDDKLNNTEAYDNVSFTVSIYIPPPSNGGGNGGGYTPPEPENMTENASSDFEFDNPDALSEDELKDATAEALGKVIDDKLIERMLKISERISPDIESTRSIVIAGGTTTITTKLIHQGDRELTNFIVYETLPKEFAEHADDVIVTAPGSTYYVVNPDPEYLFAYPKFLPKEEILITYQHLTTGNVSVLKNVSTIIYAEGIEFVCGDGICESDLGETACPADCVVPTCTYGARRCIGNILQMCSQERNEWITIENCEKGCDATFHMCKGESPSDSISYFMYVIILIVVVVFAKYYHSRRKFFEQKNDESEEKVLNKKIN
ncbi:MAG: LamG domain-containing protein [Candidatus Aenigmatarchaeota archaeon]|nr:LamG domain-containing protein [Nanoarchaeota archaeon]